MLSKDKRLNLKNSFSFVAAGKKIETAHFKLFLRSATNTQPLIGIALAKKNFRKAHKRNRAKRLTSTVIESVYPNLSKNLNLVIMPKSEVLESQLSDLLTEIKNVQALYSTN